MTLARWGLTAITSDAEAIASELVANAARAAAGGHPVMLTLHDRPPELRIYVWDSGPGHPQPRHPGSDDPTGRGLVVIDALTGHHWGWHPTPHSGGKVTWATLTTTTTTASEQDQPTANPETETRP